MSADLSVFRFDGSDVRTVIVDGEPWWIGNDVARVLGYANPAAAIAKHTKGVAKRYPLSTAGGVQEFRILSEPDMLRLVVASNLPSADRFERWVFEDVLPTIRKTGTYAAAPALPQNYSAALRELAAEVEQREALEAKVAADAPKVEYIDTFVADEDLRILRNVAKSLGLKEDDLRNALVAHKWVYREETTRYSQKEQQKVPYVRYSAYADKRDYFRPVPNHDAPRFKGEVMHTLKVTPAGATAIARAARTWGLAGEVAA